MKEMNYLERTIFLCYTMSTLDKRQQNALEPNGCQAVSGVDTV